MAELPATESALGPSDEPSLALVGKPVSRTDLVVDALKRAILNGSLRPGETLSERDIASRLGVSKTPVRDALKLLLLTGLVEMSSHQRMMVRRIDRSLVAELYQTRQILEPAAVELAVSNLGPGESAVARKAIARADDGFAAGDVVTVSLANRQFHRELYQGCQNRFLLQQLDRLQDLTALSATLGRPKASNEREAREHHAVLAAFEAGEPESVAKLVREHVANARKTLLDSLE